MRVLTLLAIATLTVPANATDLPNCGPWIPQTNGVKWRVCTDQNNQRYCEMKVGSATSRMICP